MNAKFLIPQFGLQRDPIALSESCSIGRNKENKIHLDHPDIAPIQAVLEKKNACYFLRDEFSKGGTFVNQKRIRETPLTEGDLIKIGSFEFIYQCEEFMKVKSRLDSNNPMWRLQLSQVPGLARSDLPVLILGESGTGKEVLAEYIHRCSFRKGMKFMSVNCSAFGESLIESELFGHMKGSFTGATQDRKGAFESARGGTLFLDEIGDLPLNLQPKLLRALENSEIKPVGSDQVIKTNVRIVAATHLDLKKKIIDGLFRPDLFYRLNVLQLRLPKLKDRMEDFEKLLFQFARDYQVAFSDSSIQDLKKHHWPGNIRELKNIVSRASALFPGEKIQTHHLDMLVETMNPEDPFEKYKSKANLPLLKEIEKELIKQRLIQFRGNQRRAAADLGMPKSTLNDRIKQYGINIPELLFAAKV